MAGEVKRQRTQESWYPSYVTRQQFRRDAGLCESCSNSAVHGVRCGRHQEMHLRRSRWRRLLRSPGVFITRRTPHTDPGVVYAWLFTKAGIVKGPSCSTNGSNARRYAAIAEVYRRTHIPDLEPELLFEVPFAQPYEAEQLFLRQLRERGVRAEWGREFHAARHKQTIEEVVTGSLI